MIAPQGVRLAWWLLSLVGTLVETVSFPNGQL